jgi:hypothetical protein
MVNTVAKLSLVNGRRCQGLAYVFACVRFVMRENNLWDRGLQERSTSQGWPVTQLARMPLFFITGPL